MLKEKWWQSAVFYQIYPRSFADANGDGIGDLQGIISKLDYLKSLGIGAIWLSPHFPSPQVDCGYDVSDYRGVAPEYGTMSDFKELLTKAHEKGIKLVLDMVFNHTSEQHEWFKESRSSKTNSKREWYIWKKGDGLNPPNNWYSTFGGSAWEYEAITDEYYYHFFFKEQPDLNWSNPEVKQAMWREVRYWLDMGVDGFRLDAIGTIFEDPKIPDQDAGFTLDNLFVMNRSAKTDEERTEIPENWEKLFHYQHDQPGIHELMKELRKVINEYDDRVLIGETDDIQFYGDGGDELQLVFNFPLMRLEKPGKQNVIKNQEDRLKDIPGDGWPCNTLGNHDTPRMLNHFGDGKNDIHLAKLHLALIMTLKGTPVLYNGEELGMRDMLIDDPDLFRDPLGTRAYELEMKLMGSDRKAAIHEGALQGRDKDRTPMQWSDEANAGFCPPEVKPWLPVNPDFADHVNEVEENKDPDSLLNFYRRIINFRQGRPALMLGTYEVIENSDEDLFTFSREYGAEKLLVVLNFVNQNKEYSLDNYTNPELMFAEKGNIFGGKALLKPFGVLILRIQ